MVKIKFKEGPHFEKLSLIKYVYQECRTPENTYPSLREAKQMVESGVIECPEPEYHDVIKMIEQCGGIQICEQKPLPDNTANVQVDMSTEPKKANAIYIVPSTHEGGLAIESRISVGKYVFQTLNDNPSLRSFIIDQMPFICRLTQFKEGENEYCSLLSAKIPVNHNTVDEITALSKVVRDVHTEIISTIYRFRNLARKFNPFIDDVDVETRTNSDNLQ